MFGNVKLSVAAGCRCPGTRVWVYVGVISRPDRDGAVCIQTTGPPERNNMPAIVQIRHCGVKP